MNPHPKPDDPVTTTERSIEILNILKGREEVGLEDLAEELDMALSTVYRHLATLCYHGFVCRTENGYRVGLRPLDFGNYARKSMDFFDVAREQANTLADETGEKVRLNTVENGMSILLFRRMGDHPLRTAARVGKRQHLHHLAAGKAMLADMEPERVERIIERHGLPMKTKRTIDGREELFEELETVRERGYGLNLGESIEGLNAIGSAVHDESGTPVAALSISGPANRLSSDYLVDELSGLLLITVDEVEINMKHD